jgi:hypothetical protein
LLSVISSSQFPEETLISIMIYKEVIRIAR